MTYNVYMGRWEQMLPSTHKENDNPMAIDPICGMEVDEKTALRVEHEGKTYYFCSPGCRDKFLAQKGLLLPSAEAAPSQQAEGGEPQKEKAALQITGMHCASCAATIEESLNKVEGVSKAAVNFATEKAYVEYDPAKQALRRWRKR